MPLNAIISCARKCREKEEIKEYLRKEYNKNGETFINIYDCNDTPTDFNRTKTKQEEIDEYIRERTDWFIFICPFDFVGEATFHELDVAIEKGRLRSELPHISIFFSKHPDKELARTNEQLKKEDKSPIVFRDQGDYKDVTRSEIKALIDPDKKHYFPEEYEEGTLEQCVDNEFKLLLENDLLMRKYETPCYAINAADIFFDANRTLPENGFNDFYVLRDFDKQMRKSQSHMLICGAPASGKTRAVYEMLKNDKDSRYISVRSSRTATNASNLHKLVSDLKEYDRLLDMKNLKVAKNETRYIVIDQVDARLGDADFKELEELFNIATSAYRPDYRIILTTTQVGYDSMQDVFDRFKANITTARRDSIESVRCLEQINIGPIAPEVAETVWRHQREKGGNKKPTGKVIGDYIVRFTDYTHRLVDNAMKQDTEFPEGIKPTPTGSMLNNSVGAFVRSVQLVNWMRKKRKTPLCLVLMTMRQMLKDNSYNTVFTDKCFAKEVTNVINKYLLSNHIIELHDNNGALEAFSINSIDCDKEQIYDEEKMKTIVSPDITIAIVNDKAWEVLMENSGYDIVIKYKKDKPYVNPDARAGAQDAIDTWFQAFKDYSPLATLRRILTRSPLLSIDKIQGINGYHIGSNLDIVKRHLDSLLMERKIDIKSDDYKFFHRLWICRFYDADTIRGVITDSQGNFKTDYLSYTMAGEIIGQATEIARINNNPLYNYRLNEHYKLGVSLHEEICRRKIPFDYASKLYFHQRMIECKHTFDNAYRYMEDNNLPAIIKGIVARTKGKETINDKTLASALRNCEMITNIMAEKVRDDSNFQIWLSFVISTALYPKVRNLYSMISNSTSHTHVQTQHKLLRCMLKNFDLHLRHPADCPEFSSLLQEMCAALTTKMLNSVPSRYAAKEILQTTTKWAEERLIVFDPDTLDVWENKAICACQSYEYNFLLRDITNQKTGEVLARWADNQTLRETLLKAAPSFDDKMELYRRLYFYNKAARKRKISSYTFANIWAKDSVGYYNISKKGMNNAYESFMCMMEDCDLREEFKKMAHFDEESMQNSVFSVYDTIVTPRQEEHFIGIIGKNSWNNLCSNPLFASLRIKKSRIYDLNQRARIASEGFRTQLNDSNRIIDEGLFCNVCALLKYELDNNSNDKELLIYFKERLREYARPNAPYGKRLIKNHYTFKSYNFLGIDGYFNNQGKQSSKKDNDSNPAIASNWFAKEGNLFGKELKEAMTVFAFCTAVNDDKHKKMLDSLLKKLSKITEFPSIVPDISIVNHIIMNRIIYHIEEGSKDKPMDGAKIGIRKDRFRNVTPKDILRFVECIYCERQLPLTVIVINNILIGFRNYYRCYEMNPKYKPACSKVKAWNMFAEFIKEHASYIRFSALTVNNMLLTWPDYSDELMGYVRSLSYRPERLLKTLKSKFNNTDDNWAKEYDKVYSIIDQS